MKSQKALIKKHLKNAAVIVANGSCINSTYACDVLREHPLHKISGALPFFEKWLYPGPLHDKHSDSIFDIDLRYWVHGQGWYGYGHWSENRLARTLGLLLAIEIAEDEL